ncbi:MAG TPA: C80 family cysteine peptidase [Verrucomicrobiae bacterium]|jgi:hypothetical protein
MNPEPPDRAVTGYDRQLILVLADGADDAAMIDQAEALDRKRREPPLPSEVVVMGTGAQSLPADPAEIDGLRRALAGQRRVALPITGRSRLYLIGMGDTRQRTLGGRTGAAVAAMLAEAGLRELGLLSIVGDGAGRDPDRNDAGQADVQATSFASLLQLALRDNHGIRTTVHARVGAVRVLTEPTSTAAGVIAAGRKLTGAQPGGASREHHAPHSKLRIRWEADRQVREWTK